VQGIDGNFYGVTKNGGAGESGTFFRVTPGGNLTTLHNFLAKTEWIGPVGGLIQASDGNFYAGCQIIRSEALLMIWISHTNARGNAGATRHLYCWL